MILIAISVLVATTNLALAQPEHLPEGKRVNKGAPDEMQCYELEGFKTLLRLDADFSWCLKSKKKLDIKTKQQASVILSLEKIVQAKDDNILLLKKENVRLFNMWKDENKKRHRAENKTSLSTTLAWSAAGVFAITTGVFLTVIFIDGK